MLFIWRDDSSMCWCSSFPCFKMFLCLDFFPCYLYIHYTSLVNICDVISVLWHFRFFFLCCDKIYVNFKVLDECLRAVSGFQGTEDLSDDKMVDPFTSDFIRMKKVSSAPSYELEYRDLEVVNPEECESGIKQWCEAMEKHMPLILSHSSAMVQIFISLVSYYYYFLFWIIESFPNLRGQLI